MRRAVRSDQPAIARFIEDAYGPRARYKGTSRWNWQFVDNPFAQKHDEEVPIWVALDGDRVVGQIAVQQSLLQVDGASRTAGWAVDIMILRSHRGAGLGRRLHDAVAGEVDILLSLKMADASRRLAEGHGCVAPSEVRQFTRWVRLDADSVRRYLLLRTARHRKVNGATRLCCNILQFHRLFPVLTNPLLWVRDLVRPLAEPESVTIAEVERFGIEIDELWERTREDYPVIVPRTAQFLNWRFSDCPEPRYRRFVAARQGRVVGYVVLRQTEPEELSQGVIVDLYAGRRDKEAVDDLVRHCLGFFGDTVPAVECGTSVAEVETVLRKHGFFRTRAHRPTCVCRDSGLRERLEQLRSEWWFSKGDHDWDQIRLADPSAVAE